LYITPSVSIREDLSAIKINWVVPFVVNGEVEGVSAYINNLFAVGNTGLTLINGLWDSEDELDLELSHDDLVEFDEYSDAILFLNEILGESLGMSCLRYDVDVPYNFTITMNYMPNESFVNGGIIYLGNGENYLEFGYNGTKFYLDNNGIIAYSEELSLPTNLILIAIKGMKALVILNNVVYCSITNS
jgi:hypothetical protein